MSIDGKILNQAIQNLAVNALMDDLRNAVIFGPPVLSKVLAEYQRLSDAEVQPAHEPLEERCQHGVRWENRCPTCDAPPQREPLLDKEIEQAAVKMAECFDYPWLHMPEKGRNELRRHALAVVNAALGIKGSA